MSGDAVSVAVVDYPPVSIDTTKEFWLQIHAVKAVRA